MPAPLENFWKYSSGLQGINPNTDPGATEFLNSLKQYSPNAQWQNNTNLESGSEMWGLSSFDPQNPDKGNLGEQLPTSKYGGYGMFTTGTNTNNMINPNMWDDDPVYGRITPHTNIKDQKKEWWDYAAPLAVGGIAGLAAGGSLLGGAQGAMSLGQKAAFALPNIAKSVASGDYGSLAGTALSLGGSALGINPAITSVAKMGLPIATQYFNNKGNNGMANYNPETSAQSPYDLSGYGATPSGGGGDFLGNAWNTLTNSGGSLTGLADAAWLPALGSAAKQWYDSGQYMKGAREAANISNPAGDRSMYVNKLKDLYSNPNAILSDPSYQFRLNQGMGNVGRKLAASGYMGSGKEAVDLTKFAQDYASTEWEKEVNRLANLGGFQFDPANAGKMLMTGQQQQINAQNQALASAFMPLWMRGQAGQQQGRPGMSGVPQWAGDLVKKGWQWISGGNQGGGGFLMNPTTGQIQYGPGGTIGEGDMGGFVGDPTDPTQGFGQIDYPNLDTSGDSFLGLDGGNWMEDVTNFWDMGDLP